MELVLSLQMLNTALTDDSVPSSSGGSSNSNTCSSASTGGCQVTGTLF